MWLCFVLFIHLNNNSVGKVKERKHGELSHGSRMKSEQLL